MVVPVILLAVSSRRRILLTVSSMGCHWRLSCFMIFLAKLSSGILKLFKSRLKGNKIPNEQSLDHEGNWWLGISIS